MASAVKYTLAVIDVNPAYTGQYSPGYVNAIRAAQFRLGNLPNGSCVDTRGFTRIDAWHMDAQSLTAVGNLMAEEYINNFVPEPTSICLLAIGGLSLLRRKLT